VDPALARFRTSGLVVGGVGVLGLGAGLVLTGLAAADYGRAEGDPALCPGKVCTPAGRAVVVEGDVKAIAAQWAIGAGAAVIASGVLIYLVGALPAGRTRPASAARALLLGGTF
jgi:hypothetical protein